MGSSATARLCPDSISKVLFDVPAGAVVEMREAEGEWLRVLYDGATGWVPVSSLKKRY